MAGRLTAYAYPGLGVTTYDYDANDNPINMRQSDRAATFTYDYLDRLLDESWTGNDDPSARIDQITRIRDANGNLTRVSQDGSEGTYFRQITYDNLDRPVGFSDSRGLSWRVDYEDNGNRSSVTHAGGDIVRYAYDDANRLSEVTLPGAMGVARYTYEANGLPQSLVRPNGTRTDWGYDAANRPTAMTHQYADGSRTAFTAEYFGDGSRSRLQEDRGELGVWETTFTYDDNSRMTGWTRGTPENLRTTTLTLDAVGNRLAEQEVGEGYHRDRTYDLITGHRIGSYNEVISLDGQVDQNRQVIFDYDGYGNRIGKTTMDHLANTAVRTDFVYDARNRLRRVAHEGAVRHHFDYDDLNRRIRKSGDSRQAEAIQYVWDELSVLDEFSDTGLGQAHLASYHFGLQRLAVSRVGDRHSWYHHDPMASIADLSGGDGNLVEAVTYDPFGKREEIFQGADGGWNRYAFTGHEFDAELGLSYAKARFFDHDIGLFTNADPLRGTFDQPPSLHRYLYANGNPSLFFDPTGESSADYYENRLHKLALDQDQNTFVKHAKALFYIGGYTLRTVVDGISFGSLTRAENALEKYATGEIDGWEATQQIAVHGGITAVAVVTVALTGGLAAFATRAAGGAVVAGFVGAAASGAASVGVNDLIAMEHGEQQGFSPPSAYLKGAAFGLGVTALAKAAMKFNRNILPRKPKASTTQASKNAPKNTASHRTERTPTPVAGQSKLRAFNEFRLGKREMMTSTGKGTGGAAPAGRFSNRDLMIQANRQRTAQLRAKHGGKIKAANSPSKTSSRKPGSPGSVKHTDKFHAKRRAYEKYAQRQLAKGNKPLGIRAWADKSGYTKGMERHQANIRRARSGQEIHHFATNKHSRFTSLFEDITNIYGLDLDGTWNKMLLPHRGRHTHGYHEFVLEEMRRAHRAARGDVKDFLTNFRENVIDVVIEDPGILYR